MSVEERSVPRPSPAVDLDAAAVAGAPIGSTQGFIAISRAREHSPAPDLRRVLAAIGAGSTALTEHGSLTSATWGLAVDGLVRAEPLLLSRTARRRERDLTKLDVRRLLDGREGDGLAEVLPTFAAADVLGEDTLVAATDALGFRHLYHGSGDGFVVVSTSARAVAAAIGAAPDREAIAIQSLLGWQIGQRTLFAGVRKLAPGELVTLSRGRSTVTSFRRPPGAVRELDEAVEEAAGVLRGYMAAFLDDHPDAAIQLTGGQDSRLLLSAVEPERRRGLRTATLGLPGNPDVEVAAALSRRYDMRHDVLSLDGIEGLDPAEADRLCLDAARRLDCMADPLAHAALSLAESRASQAPRVCGLGGEVARGFYYLGPVRTAPVTRGRVERLTRWRMFANESVAADALDPGFVSWARGFAVDEVYALCADTGLDWMAATDDFYLRQRMQRWAGVTDTAVCLDRIVSNPMLDDRFIEIAEGLAPRDKRNSIFLSRLQVALDGELARIPLDGRPAPIAYAERGLGNSARQMASTVQKAAKKIRQRVGRENRPPAGGETLARMLVGQWRREPETLDPVRDSGVFREDWIDRVLAAETEPAPSAVTLVTNLRVAAESRS